MGDGDGLRFRFDCVALVEESSSDASVASESASSTGFATFLLCSGEAEGVGGAASSALLRVAGGDRDGDLIVTSVSSGVASFAFEILRGDPAFFGLSFGICFGRSLSGAIEAREGFARPPVA